MTYNYLIGQPFEMGARGPERFDCYGLVKYLIERDTGHHVPDYESPDDVGRIHALMTVSILFWNQLPGPRVGSMVMFRLGREACHVGYVIGNDLFIHAWQKTGGVTIERLSDWEKRIVGFYEYIEKA